MLNWNPGFILVKLTLVLILWVFDHTYLMLPFDAAHLMQQKSKHEGHPEIMSFRSNGLFHKQFIKQSIVKYINP